MPESSTLPAATPRRCSNCKAQLPDTPVSICPYCVMPVGEGDAAKGESSKNAPRLAKVLESEAFAEAQGLTPPEGPDYQRGGRLVVSGWTLLGVALLWWVPDALLSSVYLGAWPWACAVALWGVINVVRGAGMRKRATAHPLLRRPAVILSRRSEVELKGMSGSTTYFFELELEDGAIAEFSYPGRGPTTDPYNNNMAGVAYTRGQTLLEFKQVRT